MRARFPLLEILLVIATAFAGALLLPQVLPYRYGIAVDLVAGRWLYYRQLPAMTFYAEERQSILAVHYRKYVGPLPKQTRWVVSSAGVQYPKWLIELVPPQPPPQPSTVTDAVHEINQLVQYRIATDQVEGRLSDAARGAIIERSLDLLRRPDGGTLAFNYLRGLRRQLRDTEGWINPDDFPTPEEYLLSLKHAE